jgi:glycosylphosphatidylinositol transamidase (GPIT) subunit GPI8
VTRAALAAAMIAVLGAGCGSARPAAQRPPPREQHTWALLVAGSHGWENHRHQADVLAQYRLLRSRGVPDSRIVLVSASDLPYAAENPRRGTVRQRVGGENLARDVVIDYAPDQLDPGDLSRLLSGRRSDRLSQVIRSRRRDNVYVYLSGHGTRRGLSVGDRSSLLSPRRLRAALDGVRSRRTLIVVEACNAAVFGPSVRAPGAALLAAAGSREKSLGVNYDPKGATWLADEFSYRLERMARERPGLTLTAAYDQLRREVRGSHPGAFGQLRGARLGDFFSR